MFISICAVGCYVVVVVVVVVVINMLLTLQDYKWTEKEAGFGG